MSYRDQYAGQYRDHQPRYSEPEPDYNSYPSKEPHPTYDQGAVAGGYESYDNGYRDDGYNGKEADVHASSRQYRDHSPEAYPRDAPVGAAPYRRESNDRGEFTQDKPISRDKSASAIRTYRLDHRGNLWTKGGRGRCVGRFFCCTLATIVVLVISVGLALALWIKPPNIEIKEVAPLTGTGSTVQFTNDGLQINLGINITVDNPNYFSVNFKRIKAEIFYPINDTPVGGGESKDVIFKSTQQTNWTFPFKIDYQIPKDPGGVVLEDLAKRCGLNGTKSPVEVKYKITLGLRILFIVISPVVTNTIKFDCPVDLEDLRKLLASAGLDLNTLAQVASFLGD